MQVIKIMTFKCTAVAWFSSIVMCDMTFTPAFWVIPLRATRQACLNSNMLTPPSPHSSWLLSPSHLMLSINSNLHMYRLGGAFWNIASLSPRCPQISCVAQDDFELQILSSDCRLVPPHRVYEILLVLYRVCLSSLPSPNFKCFTLCVQLRLKCSLFEIAWTCFSL